MPKIPLSLEYLKEHIHYNPDTGKSHWIKVPYKASAIKIGRPFGVKGIYGYLRGTINRKMYVYSRLVWFYYYGEWPKNKIDHINGIKDDNRICNLRDITQRENCHNLSIHRAGKLPGYSYNAKKGGFISSIYFNKNTIHLGVFKTAAEANRIYLEASSMRTIEDILALKEKHRINKSPTSN